MSRKKKNSGPSRPSKKNYYRPVPASQKILPARPGLAKNYYRPVPAIEKNYYRPVPVDCFGRKLPSRRQIPPPYFAVSSASGKLQFCDNRHFLLPIRPVEISTLRVKPWLFQYRRGFFRYFPSIVNIRGAVISYIAGYSSGGLIDIESYVGLDGQLTLL